ncbi:hypothetical protein [Reyranella soli]|jgi:hypothetical protein|uniref:Uncharacterized protein n=1 Tax=Reyranella soli TaxID=1230389 RepID=A0A512N4B5_9HYPH|nr:hypothetical protein [Reyranella soli]GEP53461.1 hypothetical protein RSO01_06270 [Reyranella soli]
MKHLTVASLVVAAALVPAHADDGSRMIDEMPIMDFYMHIVPPDWKALVENSDVPCQMPAHALIRDLSPLLSSVEITCADHKTFVVRQIRRFEIVPRN